MEIGQIVNVVIRRRTNSLTRAGFGTALVLGSSATFAESVRTYTDIDGVKEDFATGSLEYKAALRLFGQPTHRPQRIMIGKRTAKVAQVSSVALNGQAAASRQVVVDGVSYTHISTVETAAQIRDAIIALINADANSPATASSGGASAITLTAKHAGSGFDVSVVGPMTASVTTANNGVVEDMGKVDQIDDSWYLLILTSRDGFDIMAAADAIQAQRRVFFAASADNDIPVAGSTDILSMLKAKSYDRTLLLYSTDQANMPEAALAGLALPYNPGSYTVANKGLSGFSAEKLSSTKEQTITAKNGNFLATIAGQTALEDGRMVNGEWLDIIHFQDWLQAQIEETVYGRLHDVDKVPYTNAGAIIIQGLVLGQLQRGVQVGGLKNDPEPTCTVPDMADIAQQDRIDRILPDVEFSAELAGAVHKTRINGSLSV